MGIWSELKPSTLDLKKVNGKYPWVFAIDRDITYSANDTIWHTTLLFRNAARTIYGIKEFEDFAHFDNICKVARRIVEDKTFRDSLLSDDPELPRLWKRR